MVSDAGGEPEEGRETRPVAVLVGPPGSGKTTIGRLLAQRLGVGFLDTDLDVEADQGRPISDIFLEDGEPAFRMLERSAVARALTRQSGVIAVGGGAPLDETTRAALVDHVVVFLDVGIADASRRIGFDRSRPLLAVNPRATWVALMADRRPVYEGVATHHVDTAGRSPEEIVEEIVARLEGDGDA